LAAAAQVAAETAVKINESQVTFNNQTQIDQEIIKKNEMKIEDYI
jgi:hypothetical protein